MFRTTQTHHQFILSKDLEQCVALTGCESLSATNTSNFSSIYRKLTEGQSTDTFNCGGYL